MKNFKGIISASLALMMAASMLSGCSKAQDSQKNTTENAKTAQVQKDPLKIRMLLKMPNEFPQENNQVIQEIEKRANVKLDLVIPPSNDFTEKRNLLIASGEQLDVIVFGDKSDAQYTNGIKNGAFADVKKYVDKAANIQKYVPQVTLKYAMNDDGTMTAIPGTTMMRSDGYVVRKDWMDKLGIKETPKTIDDLYEMFKAFAKKDPDGNGKDDTYALSENNGELYWINKLLPLWGAGLEWQEDSNGNLYHTDYSGDAYKEALKFATKLMKEGIVDPEILANKTLNEKWRTGKLGVYGAYAGWMVRERNFIKANIPTAELTYMQIPNNKDGKAVRIANTATGHYFLFAVSSRAKDPEGIVKFYDDLLSDNIWDIFVNGLQGIHYNVKDGKKELTPEFTKYNVWRTAVALIRRPDVSFYVPRDISEEDAKMITGYLEEASKNLVYDKAIGYKSPTTFTMAKTADWGKKKKEVVNKIIYGQAPLEDWDKFVKEYRAAGFDQIEKETNEWYQKNVKGKK